MQEELSEGQPPEYSSLLVNGEPYIQKNIAIQQPWCINLTINDILNSDGNFKKLKITLLEKGQFFTKILSLKIIWEILRLAVNISVAKFVRAV